MINEDSLTAKVCRACEGGMPPLTLEQVATYAPQVPNWTIISNQQLAREFSQADFKAALQFINKVGALAEQEGHHPDILLHDWNKITITLTTHAVKGLSENDFILAAKIDQL